MSRSPSDRAAVPDLAAAADPAALRAAILTLLADRGPGKTICPSEAARAVAGTDFRRLMPATRAAAGALAAEGRIEVTQRGRPVDLAGARGPIRLRRADRAADPQRTPTASSATSSENGSP